LGPPFPCLDKFSHDLQAQKWEPAAFLYEPVIAGNGADMPPRGYGAELRRIASEHGAVLIAEEITTGMGRTGAWFGFEHEEITPDILVVGKALGAGYPVSAVITNPEVEAACSEAFRHVQSHQNDPLSAAVVSAVISTIEEEGLLERVTRIGSFFVAGLCDMRALGPSIRDVRGKGLMIAVQLEPRELIRGLAAHNALLDAGFIVDYQAQTGTFRLFPPYVITESEINDFLTAFATALTHS
jgi:4-aminobutyrate aminotransferase-like enzyme